MSRTRHEARKRCHTHLKLFAVDLPPLPSEHEDVLRKARLSYVVSMIVASFDKMTDVAQRNLAVLNAFRFYSADPKCTLEALPDVVKKKSRLWCGLVDSGVDNVRTWRRCVQLL